MAMSATAVSALLKEMYPDDVLQNIVYESNPLLAMIPKEEDASGEYVKVPLIYGNAQNRSATFSNAASGSTGAALQAFLLTYAENYSIASVTGKVARASRNNEGAFAKALELEMDSALKSLANDIANSLYRTSDGWKAQVNAEPAEAATTVITLKNVEDITGFEVGMVVNIWSAASGGSQRSTDGSDVSWTITNVDRDAGSITLDDAYTSSGTIAANDYIVIEGDRGEKLSGLLDWIPASAPGATAFYGVDRSIDTTRLGGVRVSGSALPIEDALLKLAARIGREGGSPDCCFLSFSKYNELVTSLGAKVQFTEFKTGEVGFAGILIHGPKGAIKVYPDAQCPDNYGFMLTLKTWKLYSMGKAFQIDDLDGNKVLRSSNSDGVDIRCVSYANLGCHAPGFNGIVTF
jgi:hypothetical protein